MCRVLHSSLEQRVKLIHGVGLVTGVMICVFTMLSTLVLNHFLNVTGNCLGTWSCLGTCYTTLIIVHLCKPKCTYTHG